MKVFATGVSLLFTLLGAQAQQIVVDHASIALFDSIPAKYRDQARALRMLFMDRSVGGNISDALDCLEYPFASAPSRCKRYQHTDSAFAVAPSEVTWLGVWDRSNWRYEYWPSGCSEDPRCFVDFIEPRIDSFDVVGFQFSYLAVMPGSKLADPVDGFFGTKTDRGTALSYGAFAARHPEKKVIWWTTSLARGIGSPESEAFNDAMRVYTKNNNLILFDVADILSHDPSARPCYDNRDGVPYLTENNPDDGLSLLAICPQYTTETEGGHLGSISAGGVRVAKAFWVLMARIAGWEGKAADSTGAPFAATPITEMGKSLYKNFGGGLYPDGGNTRPAWHNAAGLALAQSIVPLDTLGNPDPVNGKIVLMSVGMSNTTQEFSAFQSVADTFKLKNPFLVTVDGAQGGQTASIIKNPNVQFWSIIEQQRLPAKRATPAQVQVIWLKEANAGPTQAFPVHATMLRDDIKAVLQVAAQKYPNLKLAYLSSRIYGGYASTTLNPEPYAYESGFSVKWLIEQQIIGDTALDFQSSPRMAPWMSWGPYLWASGETPRLDGLVWAPDDLGPDGTHPSPKGRMKVATLLLDFFRTDETSTPWFLKSPATAVETPSPVHPLLLTVAPNPATERFTVSYALEAAGRVRVEVLDVLGRRIALLADGEQRRGIQEHSVSISESRLPRGFYIVRLITPSGPVAKLLGVR
jgi:hypothetical protein